MTSIIKPRNSFFTVGLVITIYSSVGIGLMNIAVLYFFGLPFLLLLAGFVFLWKSDVSVVTRLVCTALSVPMILFGFFLFIQLLPKAEPETFLINHDFKGRFTIIFDEKCGQAIDYKKGRRIYRVPDSGVLILRGPRTVGVMDQKFFLLDDTEMEIPMPQFRENDLVTEKRSWRWIFSKEKLDGQTTGVFWTNRSDPGFIVSSFDELDIDRAQKESRDMAFEKLRSEALSKCRAGAR